MQATDLFLGLLNGKSAGTSESFPKKADVLTKDGNAFSAEFAKALDRADKSKLLAKLSQMRNDARQQHNADIAKSNAEDAKMASKIDAQATNGSSNVSGVAGNGKADNQANQAVNAQANEKPADNSQSTNAGEDSKVQETASTSSQNVNSEDNSADDATGSVADINAKLQALADKLEKELKGDAVAKDDKVLAQFMAYLLAFFMSQAKQQDGIAPVNGDSQNVSLELNLDPNSKLSKLLEAILGDSKAADGEALKDVNVLIKLSDDKGILIPLAELTQKANADAKSADAAALAGAEENSGLNSETFDLTFSAETLKNATLVDLTDGQKDSEISLTVSVDKIVQASGQASIEALVQKLQQGAVDERMSKILEALGLSKEELAQALTQNNSPKDRIAVSVSAQDLKPAKDSGLAVAVSTVSSEFISSDSYLKSLELKSLMKDAVAETKERFDIYRKIGKLLDDQSMKPELLAKIVETKVASIFDTSFFKDIGSGQVSETKADWTSMLAKSSDTATAQQGNHVASDGSDRVVFLGRPDKGGLSFGQVLQKLDTPAYRAASGQDVSETVMKQLIQRASLSFANGNQGEVRVFLRPESLGDISLKVRMDQDTVIAKITAGSHEVKAIIEANLGQLKDALQEKGVNVGKFEVNVETGSQQQNAQNGAQDRSGDMYSSGYSGAGDVDDAVGMDIPELMDGDFSYSRIGASGASSSQLSYLA